MAVRLENPDKLRKRAGKTVMQRLQELVDRAAQSKAKAELMQKEVDKVWAEVDAAKKEIAELNAQYQFSDVAGKSEKVEFDSGSKVRVTRITRAPKLAIDLLRKQIKNDATFLEVINIRSADLNVNAWRKALDEERVTGKMLEYSLIDQPTSVSVVVED